MGTVREHVLLLAADAIGFRHLLGGITHAQPGRVLGNRRRHRKQIAQTQAREKLELLPAGASLAEIAIAWLLAQPGVTAPSASAVNLDQLNMLLRAVALKLSGEQVARLTAAYD